MVASVALAAIVGVLGGRDPAAPEVTAGVLGGPVAVTPPKPVPGAGSAPIAALAAPAAPTTATTPTTAAPTTTTVRRPAAAAAPVVKPKRPGPGTVQFFTMPSGDSDGHRRSFWVYRPGVPDSADLPVVYFLHGPEWTARLFSASCATARSIRILRWSC